MQVNLTPGLDAEGSFVQEGHFRRNLAPAMDAEF